MITAIRCPVAAAACLLALHSVTGAPAPKPEGVLANNDVSEQKVLTTADLEAPACGGKPNNCLHGFPPIYPLFSGDCPSGGPDTCPHLSFDGLYNKLQMTPTAPPKDCDGACRAAKCGTSEALATCLKPTKSKEYYKAQAELYFDFLDNENPKYSSTPNGVTAGLDGVGKWFGKGGWLGNETVQADGVRERYMENPPNYATNAIRFEWPPWLLVTGSGSATMLAADSSMRQATPYASPRKYRKCEGFDTHPFARCSVALWEWNSHNPLTVGAEYGSGMNGCGIWEEFTFNDEGEVTFVEAWSAVLPKPPRVSSRLPGLGTSSGALNKGAIKEWAKTDADVAMVSYVMFDTYLGANGVVPAITAALTNGIQYEYGVGCSIDPKTKMPVY